jgi:hypothetical protein
VTPSGSALKVVRGYAKPSIRTGYWLSISAHREISAFLFLQKFFSNGEIGRWRGHGQMSASWLCLQLDSGDARRGRFSVSRDRCNYPQIVGSVAHLFSKHRMRVGPRESTYTP